MCLPIRIRFQPACLVAALLAISTSLSADDADRELLLHGHRAWPGIRDLLISRFPLIQDDLLWAEASPRWQARILAGVVRLKATDPEAFARETARILDLRAIFLRAAGGDDPLPDPIAVLPTSGETNGTSVDPLRIALQSHHVPPPAQHIPWPVLANAWQDPYGSREQRLLILLHLWAEPNLDLLQMCWASYTNEAEDLLLERSLVACGQAVVPLLTDHLRTLATTDHSPHADLAPRILQTLGNTSLFPLYRQWLALPTPPAQAGNPPDREAMLLREHALVSLDILAQAQDAEALPLLIDRFVDYLAQSRDTATDGNSTHCYRRPGYGDHFPDQPERDDYAGFRFHVDRMAEALTKYGIDAVPLLRERSRILATATGIAQAISPRWAAHAKETVDAVIGYLEATDEASRHIAGLRWNLVRSQDIEVLLALHQATGESIADFVDRSGWFPAQAGRSDSVHPEVIERLRRVISTGDRQLVPIIAGWGQAQRTAYLDEAAHLEQQRGAGTVDPHLLREHQGAMLTPDRATSLLVAGDEAILALVRLGGPGVTEALAEAARLPPWSALANAGMLALEGRTDQLVRHLNAADPSLVEAAAQILWLLEDPRAQPALVIGAARRRGTSHEHWLQRARQLGSLADAVAGLTAQPPQDLRLSTLCAALVDAGNRPEATASLRATLHQAAESVSLMHVWGTRLIVSSGRSLVTNGALDASARAFLEAECLFGTGVIHRGVAANALAALGDERSLPVIAASADMGAPGGGNPVVPALEAFGERGATYAAAVPKLIPAQADTGLQVTHHRYGTQVLAELGDLRAVDQILEGFQALFADPALPGWSVRMEVYLRAAALCTDERLIEPVLQAAQHADLESEALPQLAGYADPRCGAALLAAFLRGAPHAPSGPADEDLYMTPHLIRWWKAEAAAKLAVLATGNDPRSRGKAGRALAELSVKRPATGSGLIWPADLPERDVLADRTRELTLPILITALRDPDVAIHTAAARAMVVWIGGRAGRSMEVAGRSTTVEPRIPGDARGVPALTDWLAHGGDPDYAILDCLGREGDAGTATVLLGLLSKPRRWVADHRPDVLLPALGRLRPPGTAEALEGLVSAEYDQPGRYAAEALALLGPEGLAILARLQASLTSHQRRADLAGLLSKAKALDLDLTRRHLEECLTANHHPEFARHPDPKQAWKGTCVSLFKSLLDQDAEAGRSALAPLLRQGTDAMRAWALQLVSIRFPTVAP